MPSEDYLGRAQPVGTKRLSVVGFVATAYLALFGASLWRLVDGGAAEALVCFAPAGIAAVLGATSQADRRQYVARLLAAVPFLSIGLLMWASSQDAAGWWLAAFVAVALIGFLALVVWLAAFATRIEAPASAAPVSAEVLARRLESLARPDSPIAAARARTAAGASLDLRVAGTEGRVHRVTLAIDERTRSVRVREFVGASGAAPRNAAERSMRGAGERYFDPTRPHAQAIWTRTWQATMIVPGELRAVRLQLDGDRIAYEPGMLTRNADGFVTLLAAVVTRSGYAWQPSLLPPMRQAGEAARD